MEESLNKGVPLSVPDKEEKIDQSPKEVKPPLLKRFPKASNKQSLFLRNKKALMLAAGSLVVVLLGVGTGWLLSGSAKSKSEAEIVPGAQQSETEAGLEDESVFPDSAEGILEEGGIEGEGTHHLIREGGPSKYVYLTSTVIDLESFVGKKVMVWGETLSGKQAGWLMDVGKVKVSQ